MSLLYLSPVTSSARHQRVIASSPPRDRHTAAGARITDPLAATCPSSGGAICVEPARVLAEAQRLGVPLDAPRACAGCVDTARVAAGAARRPGETRSARCSFIACAVLVFAAVACGNREAPRARDAAVAPALDAAPDALDDAVTAAAPLDAAEAPAITKLVASGDSTCAVLADLTIRCWGANAHGQLGTGDTADAATPVVPAIHAVVDLQLADATACALLDDASVACWGQIAWRGRTEDVLRPTGVLGVIGVKQIFVVPGRACARVANDSLVCWGNVDARGHFAAGAAHRAPTPVVGLDHIAGLTADGAFSDDGRVWHWSSGGTPKRLDTTAVQEIASRDGTLCARLDGGRVVCADTGRCGGSAAGASHTSTVDEPASAAAGKPATKTNVDKPPAASAKPNAAGGKPSAAKPNTKPTTVGGKSTAATHTPGAKPNAGKLTTGKPTVGKPNTAATPAKPGAADAIVSTALSSARQLAFRIGFCVVNTTGRLQCGDGCRKLDPIALERVDTIIDRCALLKSGTVSCFDGTKFVAVPALLRATLLAVGRAHACAVTGNRIACWGDDSHHQLGEFLITR